MPEPSVSRDQVRYAIFLLRRDHGGEQIGPTKPELAEHLSVPQTHVQARLDELTEAGVEEQIVEGAKTFWIEEEAAKS